MEPAEKKRCISSPSSSPTPFPLMRLPINNICGIIEFLNHLERISTMKVSSNLKEVIKRSDSPKCHGIIDISKLSLGRLKLAHAAFKYIKPTRLILKFIIHTSPFPQEEKSERTQLIDDIIEDYGKNLIFLSIDLIRFPFRKGIPALNQSLEHLQLVPRYKIPLDIKKLSSLEHLKTLTIKDDRVYITYVAPPTAQLESITTLDLGNNPSIMLPLQLLPMIPNLQYLTIGHCNQNVVSMLAECKSLVQLNIRGDVEDIPLLTRLDPKIINKLSLDINDDYLVDNNIRLFNKLSRYSYATQLSLKHYNYRVDMNTGEYDIFISSASITKTFKQLIESKIRFTTGQSDTMESFKIYKGLLTSLTPSSSQSERFSIDVVSWEIQHSLGVLFHTGKVLDIRFCSYSHMIPSPQAEIFARIIIKDMNLYNILNGCICGGTYFLCEKIKKEIGTSVSLR